MSVLLLSRDLLITSQAAGAATRQGTELIACPSVPQLLERLATGDASLVVVDVGTPDLDLAELTVQIKAAVDPAPRVLAFGPHVHEAKLAAARAAGCDEVLSRGQFHAQLDDILS